MVLFNKRPILLVFTGAFHAGKENGLLGLLLDYHSWLWIIHDHSLLSTSQPWYLMVSSGLLQCCCAQLVAGVHQLSTQRAQKRLHRRDLATGKAGRTGRVVEKCGEFCGRNREHLHMWPNVRKFLWKFDERSGESEGYGTSECGWMVDDIPEYQLPTSKESDQQVKKSC